MNNAIGTKISNEKTAKYTSVAALTAGTIMGASEALRQNNIFKHADEFITQAEGAMKRDAKFCTPFFKGTQEASDLALKQLKDNFDKFKNFAEAKKFDFKSIGKAGLIGAAIAGGFTALCCLSYNTNKKELQDNAKIVANEFKTAKVGEK